MRVAVVGKGMIGSAAARYLASAGHDTVLIGPNEPETVWSKHTGVFSSHYDEGRITRVGDRNPFYARVARASIDRYRQIEANSGISFFTPSGALIAGGPDYMHQVAAARKSVTSIYDRLGFAGLKSRFPYLSLPEGTAGDHEPDDAGHISPRKLVAAQTLLARTAGARLLAAEAIEISDTHVRTERETVASDQVIVAAGGWTNDLLGRAGKHQVFARTVAFFELPPAEAKRLMSMPSIVLEYPDVYVLPPIRYLDGKFWLKIGGDPEDRELAGQSEINAWYQGGGNPLVGEHLTDIICDLIPGLSFASFRTAPCVTTFTPDGLPEIRRLTSGLTIAAGACGAGAKCSDELGRIAAGIAIGAKERAT